ncbi:MAG: hypothetical protein AAGF99_03310 [Bacteroidota bacterium]
MTTAWIDRFDPPWLRVRAERARAFEQELRAEMHPDHPLFERCVTARAVAVRIDCDDVAFALADGFAIVHLTWKGRPEHGAWPGTSLFDTREALAVQLARDHEAWADEA